MAKEQIVSGTPTPFKDKDGNVIKIHDYVIDSDGNRYYVNSHCQAVPEGNEAPAKELRSLLEESQVSIMSIEELLRKKPEERRRRGGRRKASPERTAEEIEKEAAEKAAEAERLAKAAAEASVRAAGGERPLNDLHPVTDQMLLSIIPDDVLANELRRRGYTLCAVRPALIEL